MRQGSRSSAPSSGKMEVDYGSCEQKLLLMHLLLMAPVAPCRALCSGSRRTAFFLPTATGTA